VEGEVEGAGAEVMMGVGGRSLWTYDDVHCVEISSPATMAYYMTSTDAEDGTAIELRLQRGA